MARFEKDFRQLCRQIDSISGGQARVSVDNIFNRSNSLSRASDSSDSSSSDHEHSNSQSFYIEITPRDGPYANGSFVFLIEPGSDYDYPESQPIVSCLTPVYHPNIDTAYGNNQNNVCVSTLSDWDSGTNSTLEDLLQGLMFLFYSPNVDDPLTSNISTDPEEFLANVRISIEGGTIEDFDTGTFKMNYGYERYLKEQEKEQQYTETKKEQQKEQQYIDSEEEIDERLLSIIRKEPNLKQLFTPDTLDFLMNNTSPSASLPSIRHNKEALMNS